MKKLLVLLLITNTLIACKKDKPTTASTPLPPPAPITDFEGNVYKTVRIGKQVWMAENLRVTKYRNGESITKKADAVWSTKTEGYCDPVPAGTGNEYGKIYNWFAATDPRNIAPEGWRLPTEDDFKILIAYLGANSSNPLREKGALHWESPNEGATNSTGFTAYPNPIRYTHNFEIPPLCYFWSSTPKLNSTLSSNTLTVYSDGVFIEPVANTLGVSIRLIKITP